MISPVESIEMSCLLAIELNCVNALQRQFDQLRTSPERSFFCSYSWLVSFTSNETYLIERVAKVWTDFMHL